ncbi:uncharacterized protein LOC124433958 [Xenia sp. Carnegie-2017]|uniref:uncharacterized protein LOC124433958 n=1 Tax=Xenia sp. Carnegie-2017 TaxID=2897299 RepID=UPI001F04DA2F|nr:uncharacterized protein LOC124433958 [Xenia sp. Carnegie-2017]
MLTKVSNRKPSSNLSPITLTSTTTKVKPTKKKTTVTHSLISKFLPNTNSSSSTIWSTNQLPTKHSANEDKSLTQTNIWTYYTTKEAGLPSASTSGASIHNAKKMATGSGDDLIIISLASAGCIVLFLAVVVIALICVRRRRIASKVNHEVVAKNVVGNNHVSTPEAIYSEAYDLPTYPGIEDTSDVDNYTSLDRTKMLNEAYV